MTINNRQGAQEGGSAHKGLYTFLVGGVNTDFEKRATMSTPLKGTWEGLSHWDTQRHGSWRGEVRRAGTHASAPTNKQINKTPGVHRPHQRCMKVAKTRPNPLTVRQDQRASGM